MNVSRRRALRTAGFALVSPLTSSFPSSLAQAQNPANLASSSATDSINPNLVAYVNDTLAKVVASQASGGKNIGDFSSAIRMLAQHIDDTGIDEGVSTAVNEAISSGSLAFDNPLNSSAVTAAAASVQKYYPAFDITTTPAAQWMPDQAYLQSALKQIGKTGLGNALRSVADGVRQSATASVAGLQPSSFTLAVRKHSLYRDPFTGTPRLMYVAECSAAQKKQLVSQCNSLAALSAAGILALGVIFCVAITVGAGAAFCAVIGTAGGLFVTGGLLAIITSYLFAQCQLYGL
jgi:hypothetical protein